jgi:hypothetical protein
VTIDNMKLRDAAEAEGRKRYTPSTPCKRGHVSDRWTSTGGCIQCGLRKVVKSNAVRSLLLFRAPVHTSLTPEQRLNGRRTASKCITLSAPQRKRACGSPSAIRRTPNCDVGMCNGAPTAWRPPTWSLLGCARGTVDCAPASASAFGIPLAYGPPRTVRAMSQRIRRRGKVGGKKRPLARWEANRLTRNKKQCCRCACFPFPHRRGSAGTVRIGRASIEVRCTPST